MKKGDYILSEFDTKESKLKILFCAYRDWAISAVEMIHKNIQNMEFKIIHSKKEYDDYFNNAQVDLKLDYIILIGWSWIISKDILKRYNVIGMHPSDLPFYRGGSPIQHQIIKGLNKTKITLMQISDEKIDGGDILLKEDWNMSGNTMDIILSNLAIATADLITEFIINHKNIVPQKQDFAIGSYYNRRKPEDSELTLEKLRTMTLRELYNFIRALSDPYPNAYIKDEYGNILKFKVVEYIENNTEDTSND